MKIEIKQDRWLNRQPFLIQFAVFFIIFFTSHFIAQILIDFLFGDPSIFNKSSQSLRAFIAKGISGSLLLALAITLLIRGSSRKRKDSSTEN